MGAGFMLTLVNGTPYEFTRTSIAKSGMSSDTGEWPISVPAFSNKTEYIEFSEKFFGGQTGDMEADYTISGTTSRFRMIARSPRGSTGFCCRLQSMSTLNDGEGTELPIGRFGTVSHRQDYPIHNGMVFIMAGVDGAWVASSSANSLGSWMYESLKYIGDRSLRRICIPATHNSGISHIREQTKTASIPHRILVNQHSSVLFQLEHGIRFFDIRPTRWYDGEFYCGHVSYIPSVGWFGGVGQTIDEVVDDINTFTRNNKELIIVNISHDLAAPYFKDFSYGDWMPLFGKLDNLKSLWHAADGTDLSSVPLREFIGSKRSAVILRFQSGDSQIDSNRLGKGFFKSTSLKIYDQYANANDPVDLMQDQFKKLRENRANDTKDMFMLGWALTLNDAQSTAFGDLLDWADRRMNPRLGYVLPVCTSKHIYPNLIGVDAVRDTDVVAAAVMINARVVYDSNTSTSPAVTDVAAYDKVLNGDKNQVPRNTDPGWSHGI